MGETSSYVVLPTDPESLYLRKVCPTVVYGGSRVVNFVYIDLHLPQPDGQPILTLKRARRIGTAEGWPGLVSLLRLRGIMYLGKSKNQSERMCTLSVVVSAVSGWHEKLVNPGVTLNLRTNLVDKV